MDTVLVIQSLEKFGAKAASAIPTLKKLKFSTNDMIRDAAIKALSKIE